MSKSEWMKIGKNGRSRKVDICEECGRQGHSKEKCWKLQICQECGNKGHPADRCRMRLVCEDCGRKGHTNDRCWTPFCTKCHRYGHEDTACWSCENCGKNGHKTENCRLPKKWCFCCKENHDMRNCKVFAQYRCNLCGEVGKHMSARCNLQPQSRENLEGIQKVKVEEDYKSRWSNLFKSPKKIEVDKSL